MSTDLHRSLRSLQGLTVGLALADGSRLDDVMLVSARTTTVWVFDHGEDVFVETRNIIDAWESLPARSAA